MHELFDPVLADLSERQRDEVLAAFAAVEHGAEPVPEAQLVALRDVTLRRHVQDLLRLVGRTLVLAGRSSGPPATATTSLRHSPPMVGTDCR